MIELRRVSFRGRAWSSSIEAVRPGSYPFSEVEPKWQAYWEAHKTFRTPDFKDLDTSKPKYYVLDMFPYPSGSGLHVGHPEGYTASDIVARYKRMRGYNVLHPMGWDAFGLPAEQYAIQTGTHPATTTRRNIDRFRVQLKSLGFSYDWDREISTCEPAYYRWTQWIFLQLHRAGLAYQAEVPVNWCPALGTVLANEEVIDGRSERGGHPVERTPMRQWMLAITKYADRLLEDLGTLDWDPAVLEMQRNWIGKSRGAVVTFEVEGAAPSPEGRRSAGADERGAPLHAVDVFTTRPDTLFGATFLVLAPEHAAARALATPAHRAAVDAYVDAALSKSERQRASEAGVSGVFTGTYVRHPVTDARLPVYVAEYVLGGYGTGAVMAVPGHDDRDAAFAAAFGLPSVRVLCERGELRDQVDDRGPASAATASVVCGSSAAGLRLDGLAPEAARQRVIDWLEARGAGRGTTQYRLRDWLFARQRYWGEPFPVVFPLGPDGAAGPEALALPEAALPLTLPPMDDFTPTGTPEPPLSRASDWTATTVPEGGEATGAARPGAPAVRETSTMPQWAGSCWYYLRYIDPHNTRRLVDREAEAYWMPVDLYVGGAEHAVLHLLYARFWHKALFDLGVTSTPEPFRRLVSQGMILGELEHHVWRGPDGVAVPEGTPGATPERVAASDVAPSDASVTGLGLVSDPTAPVASRAYKMSKSRGNVVNPDDIVREYGADALRLYEMFMGPLRETKVWSTKNVDGVHRFLGRVWRLGTERLSGQRGEATREQQAVLARAIARVTDDVEALRFNTAIAAMMETVNVITKWDSCPPELAEQLVLLLAPFAPHIAEELWQRLGHDESLAFAPWPEYDPELLVEATIDLPVQVNGKVRTVLQIPRGVSQQAAFDAAVATQAIQRHLDGKRVIKTIWVPNRILNLIAK